MSRSSTLPACLLASISCVFAGAAARAQTAPPEIVLHVNATDLKVISRALDARPLSDTAATIARLQKQIDATSGPAWAWARSATKVQEVRP